MQKGRLKWAIGVVAASLVGLVFIQFFWLGGAIALNERMLQRSVGDALTRVSAKLEKRDAFTFISRRTNLDTLLPDIGIRSLSPDALDPFVEGDIARLRQSPRSPVDPPRRQAA